MNVKETEEHRSSTGSSFSTTKRNTRLQWLAMVALFLAIGAVGHDPWGKKEETYLFGIVYDFYITHSWLIPTDAGLPFMEKPPLYAWTATVLCDLLGSFLPLYDAARLASAFYMGLASLFLWKTARVLFRTRSECRTLAWITVLLFLGTYGVAHWGHEMITDIALLAGTLIALFGMALFSWQQECAHRAGIWLGLGLGIAFLSKGLVMPAVLGISGLFVWSLRPELHRRATAQGVLIAVLVALPFFFIWPILVYCHSPALFMEWFWNNNIGRFLGFSVKELGAKNDRGHMLAVLPLFAFPIFPLACFEVYRMRTKLRSVETLLPCCVFAVGLTVLLFSASGRSPYLLPLFPALSLLAAPALIRLVPLFFVGWNRFTRATFTLWAAAIWLIWFNLLFVPGARPFPWLVSRFADIYPPDFMPQEPQIVACCFALLAAVFWLLSFRLPGRTPLDTARIWFAGVVFVWCTHYTLLLPWINETRSYRSAVLQMQEFVDHSPYAGSCIANYQLGENVGPMVEYFLGRDKPLPMITLNDTVCPLFLTFNLTQWPVDVGHGWHIVWHGTRLRDLQTYELRLYARD